MLVAWLLLLTVGCTKLDRAGIPPPTRGPDSSRPRPSPTASGLLRPDPQALPPASLLIAGPEGVSLVSATGPVRELVQGSVAAAVDDTRGGLVYQRSREHYGAGVPSNSTTIEWIKNGSGASTALVTPAAGQFLELHDAVELKGQPAVFYTRFEGGVGHEDTVHTLMRIDIPTGRQTTLRPVGGFEASSEPISVTASLIAMTRLENTKGAFEFLTPDGTPVSPARNPLPPGSDCDAPCPGLAELSPDAETLAYVERGADAQGYRIIPEVVLMHMNTGTELRRLRLDRPDQGWEPASLDLGNGVLVVNRLVSGEIDSAFAEPWVIDLAADEPLVWQAPLAGNARLVR
jgi:hypothetical protein